MDGLKSRIVIAFTSTDSDRAAASMIYVEDAAFALENGDKDAGALARAAYDYVLENMDEVPVGKYVKVGGTFSPAAKGWKCIFHENAEDGRYALSYNHSNDYCLVECINNIED